MVNQPATHDSAGNEYGKLDKKPQTPAQLERLEKARIAAEARRATERALTVLEARNAVLENLGTIFHDDEMSYTQHARRIRNIRNDWPELYDALSNAFGMDKNAR